VVWQHLQVTDKLGDFGNLLPIERIPEQFTQKRCRLRQFGFTFREAVYQG
jgi:hypothetical protein